MIACAHSPDAGACAPCLRARLDRLYAVVAELSRGRDAVDAVLLASPDERSRVALKVLADLLAERRGSDVTEDDDVDTALERMARELVG